MDLPDVQIDFTFFWTWFLIFTRFTGVFYAIPGIGTDQVPEYFRYLPSVIISLAAVLGGMSVPYPETIAEGSYMMFSEFALGWLFGIIPSLTLSGLAVAGQLAAGTVGLAQANMIDMSLGEAVSVISRLKAQIGTLLFLAVDGHHAVIRAASGLLSDIGIGKFQPSFESFHILFGRFENSFHLAIIVSAPIIVSSLLTQFALGLITRFVPQLNVMVVTMPLMLLAGLFIIGLTCMAMTSHIYQDLTFVEAALNSIR